MSMLQSKIKVFISSACGTEQEKVKYNVARAGLKALIESTRLAEVYVFESEGASIVPAGHHYTFALEDCDVCIFIIDNCDGIPNGVQAEIDTANKHHKKSLYYFCDSNSKEETPLQKSLKGVSFAKSKVVHSFEDFIARGAADLLEDLVNIYKRYCDGRIDWVSNHEIEGVVDNSLIDSYYEQDNLIKKNVIGSIDKIKDYFSKMILENPIEVSQTNELDNLCSKFLDIMFNNQTIQNFNSGLLLKEIKKQQTPKHYEVTKKRWESIEEYYLGNLESSITILKDALKIAKEDNLPEWLIEDILIDLRNQKSLLDEKDNVYGINNEFQEEIIENNHILHYPLIDRFYSDYYEDILKKNMESKTQSPNTILFGNGLYSSIKYLSSIYSLAMINGSLTHLHLIYNKVKELSFYCCESYSNWNFRMLLIKTTIKNYHSKETDKITKHFDDIICKMNSTDAKEIYKFVSNDPIDHRRFMSKLEALRVVGYFISENEFKVIWEEISDKINLWIEDPNASMAIGHHIYKSLENIYLRVEQNQIALICYRSLKSNKRRFFGTVFNLISKTININRLSEDIRTNLLNEIIKIISKEKNSNYLFDIKPVLYIFRKQNLELTEDLDQIILKYMPEFYYSDYNLEVSENIQDIESHIKRYLLQIEKRNLSQGKNGRYSGYGNSPQITIKNILDKSILEFNRGMIDDIFVMACSTLFEPTQTIEEKNQSIELLVYLCKRDTSILKRNPDLVLKLKKNKDTLVSGKSIMSNLEEVHLYFSVLLLYSSLGEEIWLDKFG